MAIYVSSGIISADLTIADDALHILSGGEAFNTTLNDKGNMYVSNGGFANSTTMNEGAGALVSSGGYAENTTVNAGANLGVYSGGAVASTVVNDGGGVILFSGATADSTVVCSGGVFGIGGAANSTTVDDGATVQILNNGVADFTTLNANADVQVLKGGTVNSTTVNGSAVLNVIGGGSAYATTLNEEAVISAHGSGAEMTSTTANARAKLYVVDSAFAFSTTVDRGWMYVSNGGYAGYTTLNSGTMYLKDDGYAYWTTNSGGWILVGDGGAAEETGLFGGGMIVGSGGWISGAVVSNAGLAMTGGSANGTWVFGGGSFVITNCDRAERTFVFEGGQMSIAGGSADDITVNIGADLDVASGGTATAIKENGGFVLVHEGAEATFVSNTIYDLSLSNQSASLHSGTTANWATFDDDAQLHVYAGGVANHTTLGIGGSADIHSGGVASDITVCKDAELWVYAGGVVSNATVSADAWVEVCGAANDIVMDGGEMYVSAGGTVNDIFMAGGEMYVSSGGTVTGISVDGGELNVYSSAAAYGVFVGDGGWLDVSSGAVVSETFVNAGGYMHVEEGAVAVSTEVSSGGSMFLYNYAKVTGTFTISEGATVLAYNGSVIDFDISTVAPGSAALMTGLSLIEGATPDFTLTVSASQADGAYLLADGAAGFAEAITVSTDAGTELGVLTVGSEIRYDDYVYTLDLTDSLLSLAVATAAPVVKPTRGDFNGNGISDILFQNLTDPMNPLGAWMDADMWQWNGALGPAAKSDWIVYGAFDFTGDQVCDIMFRSKLAETEYAVGFYDMGEGGTFKTMGWGVTAEWELAQCGDFNGNGVADILWHNTETGYHGLWLDGTDQWVALPYSYLTPGTQTVFGVGDVTGDGCDDILINSNGTICAWDISGVIAGTEAAPVFWDRSGICLTSDWSTLGAADFDGSGIADIVVWNQNSGLVGAYMNCSSENWVGIYPSASPDEWGIPGFGDYNGDGCDDVLVRNLETGALGYWSGKDNFAWNGIGWGVDSTWAVIA